MVPPSLLTEMRGAAMSLTAAASGLVVFLLSVSAAQGQNDWGVTYSSTEICAVKGSTVEIRCSFTYPSPWRGSVITVEKTCWFTEQKGGEPVDLTTVSEYAGRVEDLCENNTCTLRIRNLRESDSTEYWFRIIANQPDGQFGDSTGVTLSVTNLQVTSESYWLFCRISYPPSCYPSYIWYKNGQKIQGEASDYTKKTHKADSYSCALKGYEDFPSPPVCVRGQNCNRVTYTERSICTFKGSSVDISCSYSSFENVKSKFWFRPERIHQGQNPSQPEDLSEDPQYAGRVQILETERGRSTLRISDLRDSDSAQYLFKFKTSSFEWGSDLPGTTLTVTALQVQVIRAKVYNYSTEAELKCHSSCSPAGSLNYVWFKNGKKIKATVISSYKGLFQPRDNISCALEGHEDFPSPPVYAPKPPSVSVSPSAEIEEGSSVTLTCSSDANPAANYIWYKENEDSPKASGQIFTITDFRAEHSGSYSCGAQNKLGRSNSTLHLTVVAGSWKLPAAVTIPVVLLAVISLSVFLWIRKRASRDSSEPEERADNREECVPDQPEQQEDLQYASVHFSNNRADPLYSNMRAARPLRHTEQQEVSEYAAIKFSSAGPRTRGQDPEEDPAALYSTVNKSR
ncbi:B-cell receptor CD22-like isoform X2 [Trematomus bernacchii]|uniref:B-cell receptor CD22-like isoform X2 n=1 Tax=Trematomus bernacchii TaxID=40690 RepID=UPI00146A5D6F|nr:B-cell receptor CD22-like isoform X2 [Trematomus bernacchii]